MGRRGPAKRSGESDSGNQECPPTSTADTSSDANNGNTNQAMKSPDSTTTNQPSVRRREQSRIACRNRRTAECSLLQDLGCTLPVTPAVLKAMDKLAVLRVVHSYIKLRTVLQSMQLGLASSTKGKDELFNGEPINDLLLRDNVFLVIMSSSGEIIYVSDKVVKSLRCEQCSVLGTSIYDHVHRSDHVEVDRLLSVQDMQPILQTRDSGAARGYAFKTSQNSAILSLKSGLSIQITGKVFLSDSSNSKSQSFFIGVGEPLTNPSDFEFPFPNFRIVMSWDMVVTADLKTLVSISPERSFLGYPSPYDFGGSNSMEMYHPEDLHIVQNGWNELHSHGFNQMGAYRVLAHGGGWAWFVSQGSTTVVQRRGKDGNMESVSYIVGRDYMISEIERRDEVLSVIQLGGYNSMQKCQEVLPLAELNDTSELQLKEDEVLNLVSEITAGDEDWLDELCASMLGTADPNCSNCSADPDSQFPPF